MSQEQQRMPQGGQRQGSPIKYGDVFPVHGDLAGWPIVPQDAALMQTVENTVIGQTPKGGTADIMQSAVAFNERAGLVGHLDTSDLPADQGVAVTQTDLPGRCIITESVGDQVVGQYVAPEPTAWGAQNPDKITIGEALEATARTIGDKPVDPSDATAIEAAETTATGLPGGIAAAAQFAADVNVHMMHDEDKTKLGDVLGDATAQLLVDKEATREDAERVVGVETRNNLEKARKPAGVGSAVAAAAWLNQKDGGL